MAGTFNTPWCNHGDKFSGSLDYVCIRSYASDAQTTHACYGAHTHNSLARLVPVSWRTLSSHAGPCARDTDGEQDDDVPALVGHIRMIVPSAIILLFALDPVSSTGSSKCVPLEPSLGHGLCASSQSLAEFLPIRWVSL